MVDYKKILEQIAVKLNFNDFKLEDYAVIPVELEDGTMIYSSTELDLGVAVFTDEALTIALADSDVAYVTKDGIKITIADGLVATIEKPDAEVEVPEVEVVVEAKADEVILSGDTKVDETVVEKAKFTISELVDGTKLYYDGELAVETLVFSDELLTTAIPSGEYTTILGEVIIVVDGKVSELKSVIDINAELSKLIVDKDAELVDLNAQVIELSTKLTKAVENFEKVKIEFGKKATTTSLKFSDDNEIIDTKVVVNDNRVKTGQMFKQYFK